MPKRQMTFPAGRYFHVYNRGLNHAQVFFSARNYIYFLELLKRNIDRYGITVTAYCLMPNHYHLLIRPSSDDGLQWLMKGLAGSYVQAVNLEQGRQGPLFQGRYRAIWVDDESYLIHLARYIHLNPVEAGWVSSPEKWNYSNYRDVIGLRQGTLKDTLLVPDLFESGAQYQAFVVGDDVSPDAVETYHLD